MINNIYNLFYTKSKGINTSQVVFFIQPGNPEYGLISAL